MASFLTSIPAHSDRQVELSKSIKASKHPHMWTVEESWVTRKGGEKLPPEAKFSLRRPVENAHFISSMHAELVAVGSASIPEIYIVGSDCQR